jgi:hypothetical protein
MLSISPRLHDGDGLSGEPTGRRMWDEMAALTHQIDRRRHPLLCSAPPSAATDEDAKKLRRWPPA